MRKRRTMTISLPGEMLERLNQVRRFEHRTASELVREALRRYFMRAIPEEAASPRDLRSLRRARREYDRGETVSLAELLDDLDRLPRVVRKKAT
jgi:Arc/MetJ-type ribon-helix-helix transcriptional regulator